MRLRKACLKRLTAPTITSGGNPPVITAPGVGRQWVTLAAFTPPGMRQNR
ncbi:hypothetical protein [Escherichia coli]